MIRFRNPGTQYNTQIQVFKELYKDYKDADSFDLDDMAITIARCNLLTSYGYSGDNALALSKNIDKSRNPSLMNVKMYAEVFRLLGWVTSLDNRKTYPLIFTYIGEHVAESDDILPLYEQCVLGINNPQEIMRVKYTENNRILKTVLFTIIDLGGIFYKHELCIGPMCIDDLDAEQYTDMIVKIKSLRGAHSNLTNEYIHLCNMLGVKFDLPDNSTRLPIAFMKTCGWIEKQRNRSLYPPKSLDCYKITKHGIAVAEFLKDKKDLRLDEFNKYSDVQQEALIRLGIFYMLKRAGYDISPVSDVIEVDETICKEILNGKELLFSPYQTLRRDKIEKALGIERNNSDNILRNKSVTKNIEHTEIKVKTLSLTKSIHYFNDNDKEVEDYIEEIVRLQNEGLSNNQIVQFIF